MSDFFKEGKHLSCYERIIQRAKNRDRPICYLEEHHIVPRSIQLNNETVLLTAKEHFVCHLLLTKMCRERKHHFKMLNAFQMMANTHAPNQQRYTSASYAYLKAEIAEAKRELNSGKNNPFYGRKHSPETMGKMMANRPSMVGINNPNYGRKHSEETRQMMSLNRKGKGVRRGTDHHLYGTHLSDDHKHKMSLALTGRTFSEKSKILLSESKKGSKNPNYGKPIPDDVKEKLSATLSGRFRSDNVKELMAIKKAKATVQRMLEHYQEITHETIQEAKQRGFIARSAPSYQRIMSLLKDEAFINEHAT